MRAETVSLAAATEARDSALSAVEAGADAEWMALAWHTLCDYLKRHQEFFVDDFWTDTQLRQPREARAFGPIVLRAARSGYIERTERSRPSVRSRLGHKPVWRSMLYRPPERPERPPVRVEDLL